MEETIDMENMILFPAIDLKQGQCVRLARGDMAAATIFNDDPADQARQFAQQGFSHLHIVDLDAAFAGHAVNRAAVESIIAASPAKLQLGGGIRDMASIENWLTLGVDRVILGTAALRNPTLVKQACKNFAGRIVVGVDARDGFVAVEGWADTTQTQAVTLAKQFEDCGVAALIYTDINRDGLLAGINVAATAKLAQAVRLPIIASGGLAGLADIEALLAYGDDGIIGVVAGRALYDGRLVAREALALVGGDKMGHNKIG